MEMLNMSWNVVHTHHGSAAPRRHWAAWIPALAVALALLALLALLMAFQLVVHQVVQTGESRRVALAAHADALWRCGTLNGRNLREPCLLALNAPTTSATALVNVP